MKKRGWAWVTQDTREKGVGVEVWELARPTPRKDSNGYYYAPDGTNDCAWFPLDVFERITGITVKPGQRLKVYFECRAEEVSRKPKRRGWTWNWAARRWIAHRRGRLGAPGQAVAYLGPKRKWAWRWWGGGWERDGYQTALSAMMGAERTRRTP